MFRTSLSRKKQLRTFSDVTLFSAENRLTMGMLTYKLPLIVIVATCCTVNRQSVVGDSNMWFLEHLLTDHVIRRMRSAFAIYLSYDQIQST